MRFSEVFSITRTAEDDWFDPHLSVDTKLFVDPLLLFLANTGTWAGAHDELIAHFAYCYELIARGGDRRSTSSIVAHRLLTFPEPEEFCLGYTATGRRGRGTGPHDAKLMADGIAVAIAAGLEHPEHIEEIGILNEGIGADSLSDAVCNVLKYRFIAYTQEIAHRHSIPMAPHKIKHSRCVREAGRWLHERIELPTNPVDGGPLLLAPELLLNDLPTLNADDWFDSTLNVDIRAQLNLTVGQQVRKEDIVRFARRHPERVRDWARQQTSRPDLSGYSFDQDPMGVVQWDRQPAEYARTHPITEIAAVNDIDGLRRLVELMLDRYRHYIEDQGGWRLLWNDDDTEKLEEAAQLVFLGVAQNYLRLFDVELDREVQLGRGPVDFKIARGTQLRLVVELKKAHNGRFWNGLDTQLPIYMQSDDCNEGWFVAIRYRNNPASQKRMQELPGRVRKRAENSGKTMRYAMVDARPQESASKA